TGRMPCKKRARRSTRRTIPARSTPRAGFRPFWGPRRGISTPPRPPPDAGGTNPSQKLIAGSAPSTRNLPEPISRDDDLSPAGEVDAVVAPLHALVAAGRDDRRVARRAAEGRGGNQRSAGPGAGRRRRADASFPNEDPDRIGRFDVRELDVRSRRKHLVV